MRLPLYVYVAVVVVVVVVLAPPLPSSGTTSAENQPRDLHALALGESSGA